MSEDKKQNTQQTQPVLPDLKLKEIPAVDHNSKLKDFQESDLMRAQMYLDALHTAAPKAKTIQELCRITDTVFNCMEKRRRLSKHANSDNGLRGKITIVPD